MTKNMGRLLKIETSHTKDVVVFFIENALDLLQGIGLLGYQYVTTMDTTTDLWVIQDVENVS